MAATRSRWAVPLLVLFACPAAALRVPLMALSKRVTAWGVQTAALSQVGSPFALSANFSPEVFGLPRETAVSQLTVTWDRRREAQVKELIKLALSGSARTASLKVLKLGYCEATDGVQLVILGARRSCRAFMELAALNNLAVQSVTWS